MTRYSSDAKQRRSKRYVALHAQLQAEVSASKPISRDNLSKQERKRLASEDFRAGRT